jgi:CHAD domain-containing protein
MGFEAERSMTSEEVVRSLFAREVSHVLKYDPVARLGIDLEGVHQLRVGARRLRSELEVVAPALKSTPRRSLERELHWLGSALGRQRDLDVLRQLLSSPADEPLIIAESPVLEALDQAWEQEHRRIQKLLSSSRYRRAITMLAEAVVDPPLRGAAIRPARELLHPGVIENLHRLFALADGLGSAPSNEDLHQLRIAAKRARYGAEVASLFLGEAAETLADSLATVQGQLGDLHDCVVALALVESTLASKDYERLPEEISTSDHHAVQRLEDSISELRSHWSEPMGEARSRSSLP